MYSTSLIYKVQYIYSKLAGPEDQYIKGWFESLWKSRLQLNYTIDIHIYV